MHFKMDLNEHFSANQFFFKLSCDFNFRGPFSPGFFRAWRNGRCRFLSKMRPLREIVCYIALNKNPRVRPVASKFVFA